MSLCEQNFVAKQWHLTHFLIHLQYSYNFCQQYFRICLISKLNNTHHTGKHHHHNPKEKAKSVTRYRWCLSLFSNKTVLYTMHTIHKAKLQSAFLFTNPKQSLWCILPQTYNNMAVWCKKNSPQCTSTLDLTSAAILSQTPYSKGQSTHVIPNMTFSSSLKVILCCHN